MKVQITNKEIWSIAIPIMLGNLAQTIINFTDTAFLGHLGVIELGASMLAGLFYFVFTTIATGFAIGIQSGQQNTGFDLSRCDFGLIMNSMELSSSNGKGGTAVIMNTGNICAHH